LPAAGLPFWATAGSLREFGLIEESGSSLKVSATYIAISTSPAGSAARKSAALEAIRKSGVFVRLLGQFASKVPDEGTIAMRLEVQEKFNRDRAKVVAKAFRSSLSDFELIDRSGNVLSVREDPSDANPSSESTAAVPLREAPHDDPPVPGDFRVEVPLGKGRRARITLPEDLTAADVKRVAAVLNGYTVE
jgi:hypothetical protein